MYRSWNLKTRSIIGGSCHRYHLCRDKHVFVATKHVFCRDKSMFAALSRQTYFCVACVATNLLWQLPPVIAKFPRNASHRYSNSSGTLYSQVKPKAPEAAKQHWFSQLAIYFEHSAHCRLHSCTINRLLGDNRVYRIILHCIVLCCNVLCYIARWCLGLYYAVLECTVVLLRCSVLCCIVLYYNVLFCIALYCVVLCCKILHTGLFITLCKLHCVTTHSSFSTGGVLYRKPLYIHTHTHSWRHIFRQNGSAELTVVKLYIYI